MIVGSSRAVVRAALTKRGLMAVAAFGALALVALAEIRRRGRVAELHATRIMMVEDHEARAERARYVASRIRSWKWWANVEDVSLRESRQAEFESNFEQWAAWHDRRSRELWEMEEFKPEAERLRDARQDEQAKRVWSWMRQETAHLQGKAIRTGYPSVRGPAVLREP